MKCHCEPVRTLVWQSPGKNANLPIMTGKYSIIQEIPTPACELARNDTFFDTLRLSTGTVFIFYEFLKIAKFC